MSGTRFKRDEQAARRRGAKAMIESNKTRSKVDRYERKFDIRAEVLREDAKVKRCKW